MFFSRALFVFASVAIALATPAPRAVGDIKASLSVFGGDVSILDSAVKALSDSSSVGDILAVNTEATAVTNAIGAAQAALNGTPKIVAGDCAALYGQLHSYGGQIAETLDGIFNKYNIFAKIPAHFGILTVQHDITVLSAASSTFINGLASKCPSVAGPLQVDNTNLKNGFDKVLAKYSS